MKKALINIKNNVIILCTNLIPENCSGGLVMKKFTRIVCLVLCLIMLVPMAAACSKDSTYGPQINMYLADEVYKLDPAYAYLDGSANKLLGMLYEGLMTINEKGKVEKALLKKYTYTEDKGVDKNNPNDDEYKMIIELKPSAWSDGTSLSANDFAYAWRRILDPEFDCEAAALLYDIKNAKAHKTTGISIDEVGIEPDKERLTLYFEHSIDPDEFLRKTASVALVPLRNTIDTYYDWSSSTATLVTNGPFMVRTYSPGISMQLARNSYYRRDLTDEDATPRPTKYVKPYCINIDFQLNAEDMMQSFENGELFYISELPMDKEIREKYAQRVELMNTLNTHTYLLNTTIEPFNNKAVRQALSLAIDRGAIASEVVYAYAATGFVPSGLADKTKEDDFAANNTAKIASEARIAEAKAILTKAGINPSAYGKLNIAVKVNALSKVDADGETVISGHDTDVVDYTVAKMVEKAWEELGFDFEIVPINAERYKEATSSMVQYKDIQTELIFGVYGAEDEDEDDYYYYEEDLVTTPNGRAQFDVIAIDSAMLMDDEFYALAPYATQFSGSMMVGDFEDDVIYGHMSGFNSAAYNALIDEAYAAKVAGNTALASEKLHAAEAMLIDEMPCIPIFVHKNAVLIHEDLSRVEFDFFGNPIFNKVKLKNWKDYIPVEEEDEDDEEDDN